MGQERCECRRCRNRHCRQQKQTASKGHRKLFSVCQKKLRSQNGMTLTELLAAISDEYYTAFDGYTYSEETACFRVQNLAIYRKKDTMGTSRKAVVKPINLTVRAVNLDQK